jgi:hypothetical protein
MKIAEALAKPMSSNCKSGDKSLFPTTIVMLVQGSIKQPNLSSFFARSSENCKSAWRRYALLAETYELKAT